MIEFRPAKLQDIRRIQQIEKEYYEGFSCPGENLSDWIDNLSENFIVAEKYGEVSGFIFFEYIDEIKAIPFIHQLEHKKEGKYVYISEIGILDEFQDSDFIQKLFDKMLEKSKKDGCEKIIWLTGAKSKHDKIELKLLLDNGFVKGKNVKHWEAYPGRFVDDHHIWTKDV